MSIASSGLSALGKLAAVVVLAVAFMFGLAGVVYMSLQGAEVKVPDITGKDFIDSEKELALLGLKIKKRADRASAEKPNTVIEQLPKPGDTVKTGQMILVVTSKQRADGEEAPASLKPGGEEDDTEKIEEMITDKPKKPKANANVTRKKADTTRDVGGDNSNSNSSSNSSDSNSNKKEPGTGNPGDKPKNTAQPVKPGTDPKVKPKPQ
ncbi:MAG: PASTA domain-containing protein [Pyrinomonadaceae bacterium]